MTLESKTVKYLGKELKTDFWCNLTDEKCNELREDYYKKPSIEKVEKELIGISRGGVKNKEITNYYFKEIMAKVKFNHSKWSIEEVFQCNDIIRVLYGKTTKNKNVFPDSHSDIKKIETHIRLAGKGVACKPTKFPIKAVRDIISTYNINDNYYDFSCGWGDRLLGAISSEVNYFGTDPNYLLTEQLEMMNNKCKELGFSNRIVDIRTQGSEIYVPEWENTIGMAFSSPPYFNLEMYEVGNQSCNKNTTFNDWVDYYYRPTIECIDKYLVYGGSLIININNVGKVDLVGKTIELLKDFGFVMVATHGLKNITRVYGSVDGNGGKNSNNEEIMVFKRVGEILSR